MTVRQLVATLPWALAREPKGRAAHWRRLRTWMALGLVFGTCVALSLAFNQPGVWGPFQSLGAIATALFSVALVVRLLLWWRYRPLNLTSAEREQLPSLTVVIPAFNEGVTVRRAIESVLASSYPETALKVIVINDGSRDDTGEHIDAVARNHPDRVQAIHLAQNQGKRQALYQGFRRANSTLVATLDSDSMVPRDSLAQLVVPLMRDDRVGAVAGKVLAHNRRQNLLTRMLGVRYILGFDFVRAYQSQLRTVWCCPGALQAYRLSLIKPHLERWRDQRFLRARCTNGDDHAMTNLVLSLGADSTYQSNAPVETIVPSRYATLARMYIRWGRSATREGLRAMRFAGRRCGQLSGLRGSLMLLDALLQPLTILARIAGLGVILGLLISSPAMLVPALLFAACSALLYALIFLRSERSWDMAYALLYALFATLTLAWVQPFATLTVRQNGWLTRR